MAGIGGTVADLLDGMSLIRNELDTSSGGTDEARAIKALTHAQRYFETVCAAFPRVYQSTVNVATAAQTETSTWSTSLRRLDALWLLDPTTSLPIRKMERIDEIGGHVPSLPWPLQVSVSAGYGMPGGYYANMANFYWLPMPDGVYNLRIYGLVAQAAFAVRTDNFNYHPYVILPIAQFACKLLDIAVDDDSSALDELASQLFRPLMRSIKGFDRSGPRGRTYTRVHET